MKPEIGSKWKAARSQGSIVADRVYVVTGSHGSEGWAISNEIGVTEGWLQSQCFTDGLLIPLSPATTEPAKAAGWEPKAGDRVVMSGVVKMNAGGVCDVAMDGGASVRVIETPCLRPEAAPPAAAPVTLMVPEGAIVLPDDRNLRMRLADASSQRDKFEALSVTRELELGDKEREIARLRCALRDATAKLQRRGPL